MRYLNEIKQAVRSVMEQARKHWPLVIAALIIIGVVIAAVFQEYKDRKEGA